MTKSTTETLAPVAVTLATHNGKFHADEVLAVALLSVFTENEYYVIRTRDADVIANAALAVDVGGEHNWITGRFDHHQIKGGTKSSAGLVWEYLKVSGYPQIDNLVTQVDAQDCGVQVMDDHSFGLMVSYMNHKDIYSEAQRANFDLAVYMAIVYLKGLRAEVDAVAVTKAAIATAPHVVMENNVHVLELGEFTPGWEKFVNREAGGELGEVTHVTWLDTGSNTWRVRVAPLKDGSFELGYVPLKPDATAVFIHQNGFIGGYKDASVMMDMLAAL